MNYADITMREVIIYYDLDQNAKINPRDINGSYSNSISSFDYSN